MLVPLDHGLAQVRGHGAGAAADVQGLAAAGVRLAQGGGAQAGREPARPGQKADAQLKEGVAEALPGGGGQLAGPLRQGGQPAAVRLAGAPGPGAGLPSRSAAGSPFGVVTPGWPPSWSWSWRVACRNRPVSWSRIGPVDLPGDDRGEHRVTRGRLRRPRRTGTPTRDRRWRRRGPGSSPLPGPGPRPRWPRPLPGPAPPGQAAQRGQVDMDLDLGRLGVLAGVHGRRDQPLTRLLQRVMTPLRRGPGIFRAAPVRQRVQDHLQAGRAFGRQIALQPPRAAERGLQPHRPVREPVVVGSGVVRARSIISRASTFRS